MAKKKSARGDFNMSEEIRTLLTESPKLSSGEVYDQLQAKFPGQSINRNSCNVAYSHARKKLGLRRGSRRGAKKAVRVQRPSARAASTSGAVDIGLLKSARKFLAEAGSASTAISAIQAIESLQLN